MTGIYNLKDSKNDPRVTMTVYSRADEITPETVAILKNLGVKKVSVGIETGSSYMMEKTGKGVLIKKHLEAGSLLKEKGILMYVNLLYGIPEETPEELNRTVEHFYELSDVADIYRVAGRIVTPLPNARWYYDLLKELGTSNPKLARNIEESDYFDPYELKDIWLEKMTNLTMEDIENAHKKVVSRAKEIGASLSSETPRGIV